jgi:ADP-heptose:LPS heptosyltransferase
MNPYILKSIDHMLGSVVSSLVKHRALRPATGDNGSILIIRPGGIGDAVLLVPTVHALGKLFPHAEITILAEQRNAAVFGLCPRVKQVLVYDGDGGLMKALEGGYDVVIDTEQWHRLSAVVARLTRAPLLIGYGTNERSRLFTHPVPYFHEDYEINSFLNLLVPLGLGQEQPPERFLEVPADGEQRGVKLLAPLAGNPFVAVFPGASRPERRWGADRFRRVTEMLAAFGMPVVVVGGNVDREQGEAIISGGLGLNLAGLTSLAETAAILNRSALLVSGDSGVLHIAVGLGVSTVSLFGPGRAMKWAPRGERHIVVTKGLPCSPCTTFGTTPPCPDNARCMKEITVDEVFNAVMVLLTATGALPASCCKKGWIEVAGSP